LVGLDLTLNYLLVPRLHMQGAALATLLVGFTGTIVSFLYIFSDIKPLFASLFLPRTLIISAGVALSARFIAAWPADLFVRAALTAGAYFLLLWLSKEIDVVDLRRLRESIGMSKIV